MAKLKGPLFSLGARGKLADTLVFSHWKGIDTVREYVIPANPKTSAQTGHRAHLTEAVAAVHAAQALAAHAMEEIDQVAYALLGSTWPSPRTWFNEVVKRWIDQRVDSLRSSIFHDCDITGGNTIITINLYFTDGGANHITAGDFWYGTSKTNLIHSVAASMYSAPYLAIGDLSGLTNGQKYFVQFRPTAHADFVGVRSGIYYATPAA